MKDFYGIDLGTTNSVISTLDSYGVPVAFQIGRRESFAVPSVVYYPKGKAPVVGQLARNMIETDPARCIRHIKREMGNEGFTKIIDGEEKSPEIVSADILRDLVKRANMKRHEQGLPAVYDVVVSIPAKYGDLERKRTIRAVELAGLNLISLVHEPTAAALNFGIRRGDRKTFIVYDLGGGTFDVNIMRVDGNELRILAKCGDLHCGGVDWDAEIVRMALAVLANEQKVPEALGILGSPDGFRKFIQSDEGQAMLALAEEVKINLCDEQCLGDYDFTFTLGGTRTVRIYKDQFINNTSPLVSRTIEKMEEAVREADIPMDNIEQEVDEIIMVGGSSYMPQIERAVGHRFNIRNIHRQEPGLAIAKGAALYADLRDRLWADTVQEPASRKGASCDEVPATLPKTESLPLHSAVSEPCAPAPAIPPEKPGVSVVVRHADPPIRIHEIGGRSYGVLARYGKRMVIYNIIKMSDDIEITKEVKGVFVTNRADQKYIDLDIREYDSNEMMVNFDSVRSKCITPKARMVLRTVVPIGTHVDMTVRRDNNGIIHITASCQGHKIDIEIK